MKKKVILSIILISTVVTFVKFRSTANQNSIAVTRAPGGETSASLKPPSEVLNSAGSESKKPLFTEKMMTDKISQLDEYLNRNDSYKNGSLSEELFEAIVERQSLMEKLSELQISKSQELLGQK